MSDTVASTYEILEKLGSGGGGTVYLAYHNRLRKKIALKADKRSSATDEKRLRREVDILKNLNHPYIPKVYDYFIEDGISFTAMDYIEGDSLNKSLKKGVVYRQSDVIKIAAGVLAALQYLHTVPRTESKIGYLHGDIKPANIMYRPDGSITLIDFNIALSLGDEHSVGISQGYSSPEHYGLDYSSFGYLSSTYSNTDSDDTDPMPEYGLTISEKNDDKENLTASSTLTEEGRKESKIDKAISVLMPETEINTSETVSGNTISKEYAKEEKYCNNSIDGNNRGFFEPDQDNNVPTESRHEIKSDAEKDAGAGKKKSFPDVRSDIYGVGATLYHLLSGKRPERDALDVIPLSSDNYSSELVRIITKAMQPNPEYRYQSAEEMLQDILLIHEHDPKLRRLNRMMFIFIATSAFLLIVGSICSYIGLHRIQVRDQRLKLTAYANSAFDGGDIKRSLGYLTQIYSHGKSIVSPPYDAYSQEVLTEVLGVYDLKNGFKPYGLLEMPKEPQRLLLSPNAEILAVIYGEYLSLYDTDSFTLIRTMEIEPSVLSDIRFIDSDMILYAGKDGITAYSMSEDSILWEGEHCTAISVSGDGEKVASVYKDEPHAFLYDVRNGTRLGFFDFKGRSQNVLLHDVYISPEGNLFSLNEDGSKLAASFEDGSLSVINVSEEENGNADTESFKNQDLNIFDHVSGYRHFEGGFAGKYLSFSAASDAETVFGIIDTEEELQTIGTKTEYYISTASDGENIYACDGNYLVILDPETGEQTPLTDTSNNIKRFCRRDGKTIISVGRSVQIYDGLLHLIGHFNKNSLCNRIDISKDIAVVGSSDSLEINLLKNMADDSMKKNGERIGSYDPLYNHDETRISADGSRIMLFSNDGFRIYDPEGRAVSEHIFDETEKADMYDQQYIREGQASFLRVYYYDGSIDVYDGYTGKFLRSEYGVIPDKSLDMEVETESYIFDIPIHGKMNIYAKGNRKIIAQIDEDAYVTYVTEINGGIVIQYITDDREIYGILLDQNGRKIASLPGLRDLKDEYFIFDYGDGSIYKSKRLSLAELTTILKEEMEE